MLDKYKDQIINLFIFIINNILKIRKRKKESESRLFKKVVDNTQLRLFKKPKLKSHYQSPFFFFPFYILRILPKKIQIKGV